MTELDRYRKKRWEGRPIKRYRIEGRDIAHTKAKLSSWPLEFSVASYPRLTGLAGESFVVFLVS